MLDCLSVYFATRSVEQLWRGPIVAAAAAKGWAVLPTGANMDDLGAASEGECPVVVLRNLSETDCLVVDDAIVLAASEVVDVGNGTAGFSARDQLSCHTLGCARCAILAEGGTTILDAVAGQTNLPGLGQIYRDVQAGSKMHHHPALAMYSQVPVRVGASAIWASELFADTPSQGNIDPRCRSVGLDLTGRARTVLSGPAIHLPGGRWRLSARLEIDPQGGACHLAFEWGADGGYARLESDIAASGAYEVVLETAQGQVWCSDFRIVARHPHFRGRVTLLSCLVEFIGPLAAGRG